MHWQSVINLQHFLMWSTNGPQIASSRSTSLSSALVLWLDWQSERWLVEKSCSLAEERRWLFLTSSVSSALQWLSSRIYTCFSSVVWFMDLLLVYSLCACPVMSRNLCLCAAMVSASPSMPFQLTLEACLLFQVPSFYLRTQINRPLKTAKSPGDWSLDSHSYFMHYHCSAL